MNASIGTMRLNLPAPLEIAFEEAEAAALRGEVPVGAVVADKTGNVISRAGNRTLELKDPTAHAEMLAIRAAAEILGSERLVDCDLHVTLEPCAMCAAAISSWMPQECLTVEEALLAYTSGVAFQAGDESGGVIRPGA